MSMNEHLKDYWNRRYESEQYIWGMTPSESCKIAERFFRSRKVASVQVAGCGYGRHTEYFLENGYETNGFDISDSAIQLAVSRNNSLHEGIIRYSIGDLEHINLTDKFDSFFIFNLMHLFLTVEKRNSIYKRIKGWLVSEGSLFLSVMSTDDSSCGTGKKIGESTYESKPGRGIHYFTSESLKDELNAFFDVLEIREIIEPEDHGGKKHVHHLLGACCCVPKE